MNSHFPSLMISISEGVIDLGWGHPSANLHPSEQLKIATDSVLSRGVTALQYGAYQGYGPLLESLARFLSKDPAYRKRVVPSELFLTGGASQAIDFASTLFTRNGDTVFVEDPTYYLIENIFKDHHLNVISVPTDTSGLDVDALENMLRDHTIPVPRMLYIIPTFQNPTGSVLVEERRKKLVKLAEEYSFIIIADEVYHLLYYDTPPPDPLVAFDTSISGCVISLGSFSKILGPGLRLGWMQAKPDIISRFVGAGMTSSGGGLNHFTSSLVHEIITAGFLRENVDNLKRAYGSRVNFMREKLLDLYSESYEFTTPRGGYFFWLDAKGNLDTEQLLQVAQKNGVSYRPGAAFSSKDSFRHSLRLSFALYESPDIAEGLRRLNMAIKEFKD